MCVPTWDVSSQCVTSTQWTVLGSLKLCVDSGYLHLLSNVVSILSTVHVSLSVYRETGWKMQCEDLHSFHITVIVDKAALFFSIWVKFFVCVYIVHVVAVLWASLDLLPIHTCTYVNSLWQLVCTHCFLCCSMYFRVILWTEATIVWRHSPSCSVWRPSIQIVSLCSGGTTRVGRLHKSMAFMVRPVCLLACVQLCGTCMVYVCDSRAVTFSVCVWFKSWGYVCVALVASLTEKISARSFAYHAHGTADGDKFCCYPWLECHDVKSAMHCSLRLAPAMMNHLGGISSFIIQSLY